jgi:hypothetical protein
MFFGFGFEFKTQILSSQKLDVIQSGFEPETYCLEGSCSIQLSY